jgi:hypothetical protein
MNVMVLNINPPLYYKNVPLVVKGVRYYLCSVFFFHSLIVAKLTVDDCVDKSPLNPIVNQLNPIYTCTLYLRSTLPGSSLSNQSLLVLVSFCEVLQLCF